MCLLIVQQFGPHARVFFTWYFCCAAIYLSKINTVYQHLFTVFYQFFQPMSSCMPGPCTLCIFVHALLKKNLQKSRVMDKKRKVQFFSKLKMLHISQFRYRKNEFSDYFYYPGVCLLPFSIFIGAQASSGTENINFRIIFTKMLYPGVCLPFLQFYWRTSPEVQKISVQNTEVLYVFAVRSSALYRQRTWRW